MAIGNSIRIYDLAREVKQDTKRVMEDVRREGVDVSVASNSVPYEVAEKVRSKYFPKTEAAPKRAIKVIKKAAKAEEAPAAEADVVAEEPIVEAAPPVVEEAPAPAVEEAEQPVARQVKKLTKKPAEPEPAVEQAPAPKRVVKKKVAEVKAAPEPPPVVEPAETAAPEIEPAVEVAEPKPGPTGTFVKTLKLTPDALKKGIKPGDKLVSDAPTRTGSLIADRPRVAEPGMPPAGISRHAGRDRGAAAYLYASRGQSPPAGAFRRSKGPGV